MFCFTVVWQIIKILLQLFVRYLNMFFATFWARRNWWPVLMCWGLCFLKSIFELQSKPNSVKNLNWTYYKEYTIDKIYQPLTFFRSDFFAFSPSFDGSSDAGRFLSTRSLSLLPSAVVTFYKQNIKFRYL